MKDRLENVSEGITHPFFYGDLLFKQMAVKGLANFMSPGSEIVKRFRLIAVYSVVENNSKHNRENIE